MTHEELRLTLDDLCRLGKIAMDEDGRYAPIAIPVAPGQLWRDRYYHEGRLLRVDSIRGDRALCIAWLPGDHRRYTTGISIERLIRYFDRVMEAGTHGGGTEP